MTILGIAILLAAYGVFAQGVFLTPQAAGYAFRYTVVIGLGVSLYVVALLGLDQLSQAALGSTCRSSLDSRSWRRSRFRTHGGVGASYDPRSLCPRRPAYDRLLRALGQDVLTSQRPEAVVVPALARLSRTFRLLGAEVETGAGEIIARHGRPVVISPGLPCTAPNQRGRARFGDFGPKRSLLPFTPDETELLSQGAAYLSASLRLAHLTDVQAEALESAQRRARRRRGSRHRAQRGARPGDRAEIGPAGLRVGAARVERNGVDAPAVGRRQGRDTPRRSPLRVPLRPRRARGGKDEITELIWPDIDLRRADVAFHRTLGALRRTLEPERRGVARGDAITFRNDRYRLSPTLVTWSDVGAFDEAMAAARARLRISRWDILERARALYRGDYLDDCPFYGDSAQAEERRAFSSRRYVDLLLALGEGYERRGDRPSAAASFREARTVAGEELPRAEAALARLAAPI